MSTEDVSAKEMGYPTDRITELAARITAQEDIIRELRKVLRTVRESYSVQGSKSLLELVDHALNSSDAGSGGEG